MIKLGYQISIFLILISLNSLGQGLSGFPENISFISRDNTGNCNGTVAFDNSLSGNTYSIRILKNDTVFVYSKFKVANSSNYKYSLPAGLIDYSFQLYEFSGSDSTNIAWADKVVCGDVFLIYGQSNGNAFSGASDFNSGNYDDKWVRNFSYDEGIREYKWYFGLQPSSDVGTTGLTFARHAVDSLKVPVCLINGSFGGADMLKLMARTEGNPADVNTIYGSFLNHVKETNSINKIKGFFFFHGESEGYYPINEMVKYKDNFDILYKNIENDFPPIETFVVLQTALMDIGSNCGILRDIQTEFMDTYSNVITLSSAGISQNYSGLHYSKGGYEAIAEMIFKYFQHNVYSQETNISYTSPRIKKIVKDPKLGAVRLIFDKEHKVNMPRYVDGVRVVRDATAFIYINDENWRTGEINSIENEIQIATDINNANTFTYLPGAYKDEFSDHYDGPVIRNQNGFVALTFRDVKIEDTIEEPLISEFIINESSISFQLTDYCSNCKLLVYGSKNNENIYFIGELNSLGSENSISHNLDLKNGDTAQFRLHYENDITASSFVTINKAYCLTSSSGNKPKNTGWVTNTPKLGKLVPVLINRKTKQVSLYPNKTYTARPVPANSGCN